MILLLWRAIHVVNPWPTIFIQRTFQHLAFGFSFTLPWPAAQIFSVKRTFYSETERLRRYDCAEHGTVRPGEVTAEWYPDGRSLLVVHTHEARNTLHRYDIGTGSLSKLDTLRGTVGSADVRPDELAATWAGRPAIRAGSSRTTSCPCSTRRG